MANSNPFRPGYQSSVSQEWKQQQSTTPWYQPRANSSLSASGHQPPIHEPLYSPMTRAQQPFYSAQQAPFSGQPYVPHMAARSSLCKPPAAAASPSQHRYPIPPPPPSPPSIMAKSSTSSLPERQNLPSPTSPYHLQALNSALPTCVPKSVVASHNNADTSSYTPTLQKALPEHNPWHSSAIDGQECDADEGEEPPALPPRRQPAPALFDRNATSTSDSGLPASSFSASDVEEQLFLPPRPRHAPTLVNDKVTSTHISGLPVDSAPVLDFEERPSLPPRPGHARVLSEGNFHSVPTLQTQRTLQHAAHATQPSPALMTPGRPIPSKARPQSAWAPRMSGHFPVPLSLELSGQQPALYRDTYQPPQIAAHQSQKPLNPANYLNRVFSSPAVIKQSNPSPKKRPQHKRKKKSLKRRILIGTGKILIGGISTALIGGDVTDMFGGGDGDVDGGISGDDFDAGDDSDDSYAQDTSDGNSAAYDTGSNDPSGEINDSGIDTASQPQSIPGDGGSPAGLGNAENLAMTNASMSWQPLQAAASMSAIE